MTWIGRYLAATRDKGTIYTPRDEGFQVYVDSDFAGNWDKTLAGIDRSTARSRHGYYICYGGIPITRKSSLQQEIALSSTESEVTGLSYALRDAIPVMNLLQEMQENGFPVTDSKAKVHCKVFEDNSGALEMVRLPKMRPRTKHVCVRMHHFREHVRTGKVTIHKVPTRYQLADIATKAQPRDLFESQRESLMQWQSEFLTATELQQPAEHLRACDIVRQFRKTVGQPAPQLAGSGQLDVPVGT